MLHDIHFGRMAKLLRSKNNNIMADDTIILNKNPKKYIAVNNVGG